MVRTQANEPLGLITYFSPILHNKTPKRVHVHWVVYIFDMLDAAGSMNRCVLRDEWRHDIDGWLWSAEDHYIEGHCCPLWVGACVDLDMASS